MFLFLEMQVLAILENGKGRDSFENGGNREDTRQILRDHQYKYHQCGCWGGDRSVKGDSEIWQQKNHELADEAIN